MNANPHEGTGQLKMRTPERFRIGQSIFAMTAMRRQPRLPRRTTFLAGRPHSPHRTHIIAKCLILCYLFTTRRTNAIIVLDLQLYAPDRTPSEKRMTEGTDALYEKAFELSANVPDNFLELGRALTQLYDRDPNLLRQLAAKSNMGLRRAYHLVEVSRTFEPLVIPRDQMRKIGWPKLQLVAKHLLGPAAPPRGGEHGGGPQAPSPCVEEAGRQRSLHAAVFQPEVIRATRRNPLV
jgi:hypothetical protein